MAPPARKKGGNPHNPLKIQTTQRERRNDSNSEPETSRPKPKDKGKTKATRKPSANEDVNMASPKTPVRELEDLGVVFVYLF